MQGIMEMECLFQLKVREHSEFGPYVEGLSTYVVNSYNDIKVGATGFNWSSVCRWHVFFYLVNYFHFPHGW